MALNFLFALLFSQAALSQAPLSIPANDTVTESLCRDSVSYRACYGFTYEQCVATSVPAFQKCLSQMPPRPDQPSLDEYMKNETPLGEWGLRLAYCTEEEFETVARSMRVASAECDSLYQSRLIERSRSPIKVNVGVGRPSAGVFILPLFFGVTAGIGLLIWRMRKARIRWYHGAISWVLFCIGSVVGEILNHMVFPEWFVGVGDNPLQAVGSAMAITLSFVLTPVFWLWARSKTKSVTE